MDINGLFNIVTSLIRLYFLEVLVINLVMRCFFVIFSSG